MTAVPLRTQFSTSETKPGLRLTHIAINKVMYYAHGWHLAKYDLPLIRQEFEAWKDRTCSAISLGLP